MSKNLSLPESFGITPILGYRTWNIGDHSLLRSDKDHSVWPTDGPRKAVCPNQCRAVPSADICGWQYDVMGYRPGKGCGLYAMFKPDMLLLEGLPAYHRFWKSQRPKAQWGAVEAFGRVVMYPSGFKAEKMRVVALADLGPHSHAYAEAYGVPCLPGAALVSEFGT